MLKLSEWLKSRNLFWPALVVVVGLLGVNIGRLFAPDPEVRIEERVVESKQVITKTRFESTKASTKVVYRDRLISPDGTVREREVERSASLETFKLSSDTSESSTKDASRATQVSPLRPQWRVGILAGGSVSFSALQVSPVFGALVERQIAGPFSVGVWGLYRSSLEPQLNAGVSVSLSF
jgi:hypothetical protein